MTAYFDPGPDVNLPAWAFPTPINPIHRAYGFPLPPDFASLTAQEQLQWLQQAQIALHASPNIKGELLRLRASATKFDRSSVKGEGGLCGE